MCFLWSEAHLGGKTDVSPRMYFYITVGCCSLAWSSNDIKGNTEGYWNPPSPLVAILWSRAVTLELILILIYEVGELTLSATSLVVMWSNLWQNRSKSGNWQRVQPPHPLYFMLVSSLFLLISEAGNRSHRISDVTELSNRQLKMVQFTSSTTWCKWPSPWHAHRRQTSC